MRRGCLFCSTVNMSLTTHVWETCSWRPHLQICTAHRTRHPSSTTCTWRYQPCTILNLFNNQHVIHNSLLIHISRWPHLQICTQHFHYHHIPSFYTSNHQFGTILYSPNSWHIIHNSRLSNMFAVLTSADMQSTSYLSSHVSISTSNYWSRAHTHIHTSIPKRMIWC